ncbi:hypothetical protein SCUP515_08394 [Seiridium cupressi]
MAPPITPNLPGLFATLYPINELPDRTSLRASHQLQVLALGLSRSGTDSLRAALTILGYRNVYHGWFISTVQQSDPGLWCPLMRRKYSGEFVAAKLAADTLRAEFDKVLGNCEAVTDVPCFVFAEELIKAYPEAKVVLNRRRDVDAWYKSMQDTAMGVFTWPLWVLHFWAGDLFWIYSVFELGLMVWARRDFDRYGRQVAVEHYQTLEDICKRDGREYLDWSAEDGWAPLCAFLGKDVPEESFPWENKAGRIFEKKMEVAIGAMVMRAARNLGCAILGGAVLPTALWWQSNN